MKIRWLNEALVDLVEIREYIAKDNPQAARNVANRIREAVDRLGGAPAMGRPGRVEGTRELIVPELPFIIPYRVSNRTLEILRVLHEARKSPKSF